ncbi:S-layer homology domain-containing protein [Saccharibacillus sacchari]|uniref:S-layer homology domain-containing protein n=1 Tax=Saccharibacillus sacchari TaxID=456493 RepID=A0ACC6P930_9BACL
MKKRTGLTLIAALALGGVPWGVNGPIANAAEANAATTPLEVTAHTYIGDAGRMAESFELVLPANASYAGLQASDFDITGNYDGYPLNAAGEIVQEDYKDDGILLKRDGNVLSMTVKPFKYPGGYVSEFAVVNKRYPELSFNAEQVSKVQTRTVDDFEAGKITGANGESLTYQLKLSESTEARPLVVWLHGGGEVGTDNFKQLTENRGATVWTESGYDTSVLAVQFPENYGWKIYENAEELTRMQDFFEVQMELIDRLVSEGKVDPQRIYVVGPSSGGGGTFRFLMQYPNKFAGAIAIAAKDTIADYEGSVDAFKQELKDITDTPVWIVHAENDPTTDSRTSTLAYQALAEMGAPQTKMTIYDDAFMDEGRFYGGMKHWSWVPVFNDKKMLDWLFAQKNESSPSAATLAKESSVAREDLARVLAQRLNLEEVRGTSIYADTADSSYDLAIRQASTAGVMQGVGSDRFAPDLAVTRAQLAVLADRVLGSDNEAGTAVASAYGDVPTSYWAAQAIARVTSEKIMQGTSASAFGPNRLVTGAEVEAVLAKLVAAKQ